MFGTISEVEGCDMRLVAPSRRVNRRISEKQRMVGALEPNRRKLAVVFGHVFANLVFFDQSSGIDAVLKDTLRGMLSVLWKSAGLR